MGSLPIYLSNPNQLITLPDVYFRVRDLVQQGAGTHDISKVVSIDPALTARFLSMANSALFAPKAEIATVSRAVTLLGTQLVHDIVLSSSVADMFDGIPAQLVDVKAFWSQSVACGAIAKALADHLKVLNSGHVFVQGLLADIGHVAMYQFEPQSMVDILTRAKATGAMQFRIEREQLGYDYCDIGGYLADQWGLPAEIPEILLSHQEPSSASNCHFEASIVHVAYRLAENRARSESSLEFHESALAFINLSHEQVVELHEVISNDIDEVITAFSQVKNAA
ncbi:MAG: HDOD domain-containing protein [Pseudomonadota bacterium]